MLLTFFDSEGIVHHEYAPDGQTINKEFYMEVLRCLRESVRQKRPGKWRDGDWILHHDNAPAHTSHPVQQFLSKHGTAQTKTLLDIPKKEFEKCFQQWQKRWAKCVVAERNFVEDN